MVKIQSKIWIVGYVILVLLCLSVVGYRVVRVDPFFHYHKPNTQVYFYSLDNQRSQNDGILKRFDYDALITGSSMTENFKTSEMDAIFGTKSIKTPYFGASYKEINDSLITALSYNTNLKTIIRGLDMWKFLEDKDVMRFELGDYPTYLYDNIWYNDVKYIFNRDVIFSRVYPMVIANDNEGFQPGITSFDVYSNWMNSYTFGLKTVCPDGVSSPDCAKPVHLSDAERKIILGTVQQNITSLAEENPDVTFYYFFTPYSILWWKNLVDDGIVYKQVEAEQLVIEEILQCENIKLYSFNNLFNIITDLNNYKDASHYGSWINSLMLHYMKDDKCLLTHDNYLDYLEAELSFYTSFDYLQLNYQVDYDNDYYAEALLNREISGTEPLNLLGINGEAIELSNASIIENQYDDAIGVQCMGRLLRESGDDISVADYIAIDDYVGARIRIEDISAYKYLEFYGIKNANQGQPSVYIYDQNNIVLTEFAMNYMDLDDQWHQYLINVSQLSGPVTIVFNGGYTDCTGNQDSLYTFSHMVLY